MTFVSSTYQHWVEDLNEVDLDEVYRTSYESYDAWDKRYFDYVKEVRDKLRGRLHTRDIRFATKHKQILDDDNKTTHRNINYWVYEQGDLMPMGFLSSQNKTINQGYADQKTYQVFGVTSPHVNNKKDSSETIHSKSKATAVKKALGVLHNRTLGEIAEMHTYELEAAIKNKRGELDSSLDDLIKAVSGAGFGKPFLRSNAFAAMTNPVVFEVLKQNAPDVADTITQIYDVQNTIEGFEDLHDPSRVVFVHCKENDATVIWPDKIHHIADYDHKKTALVRCFRVGEFPELEQNINSLSIMDVNDAVLDVGMKVRDNLYFVVISQVPAL
tara:strand:- start:835 stop:1818 length:984 start_codon:yes stop_codon:yes gene_type:complete